MSRSSLASCVAVAALAGSAMAQVTLSNNFAQNTLASWTETLDATAPTFQRPVANGPTTPSTQLSTTATAVRYGATTYNFAAAGNYIIATSWNRVGASGNQAQYRYGAGGFNSASAVTNNLGGALLTASATGTFNYAISAPAGPMTFVSAWSTNTSSFGTFSTSIVQDTGAIADVALGTIAQTTSFTVTSTSTDLVSSLDSITIRGLQHTYSGDLRFSLSNGTTTVNFFRIANGNDSRDYNGNYTFQFGGAALPVGGTVITPGTYAPTTDFTSAFAGASVGGTWTLSITDISTGDTGRIAGFDLNFTVVPTPGAAALLGLGGLMAGRRRR